jgi:hypothetical protein
MAKGGSHEPEPWFNAVRSERAIICPSGIFRIRTLRVYAVGSTQLLCYLPPFLGSPYRLLSKKRFLIKLSNGSLQFMSFFIFVRISIYLICIYALPDKTVRPRVGLLFSIGGAIVLGSFLIFVWKNWVSKRG